MSDNIDRRVRTVIGRIIGVDNVLAAARLRDDLGADNLTLIEIALTLEGDFDVELGDAAIAKWRTAGDVVASLDRALAARKLEVAA